MFIVEEAGPVCVDEGIYGKPQFFALKFALVQKLL